MSRYLTWSFKLSGKNSLSQVITHRTRTAECAALDNLCYLAKEGPQFWGLLQEKKLHPSLIKIHVLYNRLLLPRKGRRTLIRYYETYISVKIPVREFLLSSMSSQSLDARTGSSKQEKLAQLLLVPEELPLQAAEKEAFCAKKHKCPVNTCQENAYISYNSGTTTLSPIFYIADRNCTQTNPDRKGSFKYFYAVFPAKKRCV